NPFPDAAVRDPSRLLVMFLRDAPTPARVKALQRAIVGRETVRAVDTQAYITYPDGMGRSKLTLPMIEKALGTIGTGRNWNTVTKITGLLGDYAQKGVDDFHSRPRPPSANSDQALKEGAAIG